MMLTAKIVFQDKTFRTLEEAVHFKTQLLEKRFKQYQEVEGWG